MQPFRRKNTQIALYTLLLGIVMLGMAGLKWLPSHSGRFPAVSSPPCADTIDIALVYSPVSFTFTGDTLGGLDYDMARTLASHHRLTVHFRPVVRLEDALRLLEEGRYDIIASLPADTMLDRRFLSTVPLFVAYDSQQGEGVYHRWMVTRHRPALRDSLDTWLDAWLTSDSCKRLTSRYDAIPVR